MIRPSVHPRSRSLGRVIHLFSVVGIASSALLLLSGLTRVRLTSTYVAGSPKWTDRRSQFGSDRSYQSLRDCKRKGTVHGDLPSFRSPSRASTGPQRIRLAICRLPTATEPAKLRPSSYSCPIARELPWSRLNSRSRTSAHLALTATRTAPLLGTQARRLRLKG